MEALAFVAAKESRRELRRKKRRQERRRRYLAIIATDNGDATSFESFQSSERNAFNGLAIAIVRAKPGQTGTIKLTAKSNGLKEASVKITSR